MNNNALYYSKVNSLRRKHEISQKTRNFKFEFTILSITLTPVPALVLHKASIMWKCQKGELMQETWGICDNTPSLRVQHSITCLHKSSCSGSASYSNRRKHDSILELRKKLIWQTKQSTEEQRQCLMSGTNLTVQQSFLTVKSVEQKKEDMVAKQYQEGSQCLYGKNFWLSGKKIKKNFLGRFP